mgnify:CR=1 FL=1|tara:strand:+ start:2495 stop:3547 length:1053 start_codon:yes stop_codon:yes gene_type:complete
MGGQRWITVGIVLGLLLLAFGLLMPAVQNAREEARKTTSKNNLRQIGLALQNYHEAVACLPPGGVIREDDVAMQGWMIQVYPFMEASTLYNRVDFDQSWESPDNLPVFETPIHSFLIPGVVAHFTSTGFGLTHYLGNPHLLYRNSCVTFGQMENGTAHTWLAGEVAGNYQPWGYPFNWRPLGNKLCDGPESFGHPPWDGGHLLFADGSVSFFSDQTSPEILERFAAAPPVATPEQTAVPATIFQTGDFHWERIDLQSDPQGEAKYVAKVLRNAAGTPLAVNVYSAAKLTPEELDQQKSIPDSLQFLLQIDSTTDIAPALEATPLIQSATPEQITANVKTLQALQKQLHNK